MWHTVASLVPLPLIALGYVAAVPGNPIRFQVELWLSGHGSAQALTRTAEIAPARLPREAAILFHTSGKGPRADQYLIRQHRHLRRQATYRREPLRRRSSADRRA